MIKPTLQKPITIDSLQKYSIELEVLVHSLEYERSELIKAYNELADELYKVKEENEVLKNEIKGDTSLPFNLKLDDAYVFSGPITFYNDSVKECSSNCEACKQNCVEDLIKCIKGQK